LIYKLLDDDKTYRHRRFARIRYELFLIGVWDFARYPAILFAAHQTGYSSRLLASVNFLAASSMALRLCLSCSGAGRVSHFCLFFFTFPSRYPCITWLTQTCLERHKSFVFRLSRTAVLYVIYHGVGELSTKWKGLNPKLFRPTTPLFCDIPCDSPDYSSSGL
jgi:hypothetical protein